MSSPTSARGIARRNRKLDRAKASQHVHLDHGEGIAWCGRVVWIVQRVNGMKETKPLKPYTTDKAHTDCPVCLTNYAATRLRSERDL